MEKNGKSYTTAVAHALRRQLGGSHQAIKTVMVWTGAGERTVKNWFAGTSGPSGRHLVAIARHSDEILEVFLALAGRHQFTVAMKVAEARARIATLLQELDLFLVQQKS